MSNPTNKPTSWGQSSILNNAGIQAPHNKEPAFASHPQEAQKAPSPQSPATPATASSAARSSFTNPFGIKRPAAAAPKPHIEPTLKPSSASSSSPGFQPKAVAKATTAASYAMPFLGTPASGNGTPVATPTPAPTPAATPAPVAAPAAAAPEVASATPANPSAAPILQEVVHPVAGQTAPAAAEPAPAPAPAPTATPTADTHNTAAAPTPSATTQADAASEATTSTEERTNVRPMAPLSMPGGLDVHAPIRSEPEFSGQPAPTLSAAPQGSQPAAVEPPAQAASRFPKNGIFGRLLARIVPPVGESQEDEFGNFMSREELLARRRTKYRLIGAAVLLMLLICALPFFLDNGNKIDSVGMDPTIPKVDETTAPLTIPPSPTKTPPATTVVADNTTPNTPPTITESNAQHVSDGPAKVTPTEDIQISGTIKQSSSAQKATPPAASTAPAPNDAQKVKLVDPTKPSSTASDTKANRPTADTPPTKKPTTPKPTPSAGIEPPTGPGFYVQVVATSNERDAERVVKQIAIMGLPSYRMQVETKNGIIWRVRVGLYKTRKEAESVIGTLVLNGVDAKPIVGQQ